MIPRSTDYIEYCRDVATNLDDVQDLALRGRNMQSVTRKVQERIIQEVALRPDDVLVDIGCGDGTLLRMAGESGVARAMGLLATDEEVAVVRRLGLQVQQGLADRIPLDDESASVVVCNNVLLIVPRERVPASLREIARIARPDARVLLGEIPFLPGPPPEPEFSTARETLLYLYRRHGLRACLGMARRMAASKFAGKPMVIRNGAAVSFHAEPPEFIAMAEDAGLELVRFWQQDPPAGRYNYLFRKKGFAGARLP